MNKANETAIEFVRGYCARLERQVYPYWRSPEFAQLSYSKTAAYEVLNRLIQNPTSPPLQTIEEFRDTMSKYSCINSKTSIMYSVAQDIADDISNDLIKAFF